MMVRTRSTPASNTLWPGRKSRRRVGGSFVLTCTLRTNKRPRFAALGHTLELAALGTRSLVCSASGHCFMSLFRGVAVLLLIVWIGVVSHIASIRE